MARNNRSRNRNPLPPNRNPSAPNRNPLPPTSSFWSWFWPFLFREEFLIRQCIRFILGCVFFTWFFLLSPTHGIYYSSLPLWKRPLDDYEISPEVFHSPEVFKLDYTAMDRNFKIFMYPDEQRNSVCQKPGNLVGRYATECYFFHNIRKSKILTEDPEKAHLFLMHVSFPTVRDQGLSYANMAATIENYVQSLISKYPFWSRTLGADHFFVTCDAIGMVAAEQLSFLMKNSIRVVCAPGYDAEYVPHKDISLPTKMERFAPAAGGNDVKDRTLLAFWAGSIHSDIRNKLVSAWKNDAELDIQDSQINRTTEGRLLLQKKLYRSKFCICPGGYCLNGTRMAEGAQITEAIHSGCVPVILSDHYDLPFNDILEWRNFSVIIKENQLNQLKQILNDIPDARYKSLQSNLIKVQKHFQWNSFAVRLDAFHMLMFELWQRRHVIKYKGAGT